MSDFARILRDGRWGGTAVRVAALVGVLLTILAARVVTASRAELEEAEVLHARGDVDASIAHYRRAARWYAPGNPYSTHALERLAAIGSLAEQQADPDLALAAWRSVRGSILGARSFYVPHGERLAVADEHLAAIMAGLPPPPIDAARTVDERRTAHLALLRDVQRPALGWSLLALAGLATWIGAAFGFLTRALDEDDRVLPMPARAWGTAWILGFGAFVLGLALA